ncbi:GAP family protein [Patescibacteria group bacterium]
MKNKSLVLILVALLVGTGSLFVLGNVLAKGDSASITASELEEETSSEDPPIVVDVRSEVEYVDAHIEGAKLLSLADIDEAGEHFSQDDKLVVYCGATECEASTIAADELKDDGFSKVLVLQGGFPAWESAGYPTASGTEGEEVSEGLSTSAIALGTVIGVGLADGINPCAIGMLVFLMGYLIVFAKKLKQVRGVGIVYIATVFATYFAIGLFFYQILVTFSQSPEYATVSSLITLTLGVILIAAGVINIKDFFWKGEGFSLEIPQRVRPLLQSWVVKATLPATMILAILVTVFEMPCSLPLYAGMLDILARSGLERFDMVGYIALYNLMFVVPLIVIFILVYSGKRISMIKEWEHQAKWWMKLAMGIILIGFGIWMLLM